MDNFLKWLEFIKQIYLFCNLGFKICSNEMQKNRTRTVTKIHNIFSALNRWSHNGKRKKCPFSYFLSISPVITSAPQFGSRSQFSSVQLLSHVKLFVNPWTVARQASLSITNSRSQWQVKSRQSDEYIYTEPKYTFVPLCQTFTF